MLFTLFLILEKKLSHEIVFGNRLLYLNYFWDIDFSIGMQVEKCIFQIELLLGNLLLKLNYCLGISFSKCIIVK